MHSCLWQTCFFFQAEDGIRDRTVTGVQTCALPIYPHRCQCFIGTDVDEELLSVVIDEIGDENIVMSVDYPHADGPFPNGVKTFLDLPKRSEERRVGKECRWRLSAEHSRKRR